MSLGTMEQRTEGMKKQAKELIEQAYLRGYKAGEDNERNNRKMLTNESIIELIEKGRNEAWEAAGRLVAMEYWKCNEILGDGVLTIETDEEIFTRCTASEAIEKLKAYEAQKQEEDSEIHVGDEVTDGNDIKGVVVGSFRNAVGTEFISILGTGEDFEVPQIMPREDYKKTGRTFQEIAEILKKLKEGE